MTTQAIEKKTLWTLFRRVHLPAIAAFIGLQAFIWLLNDIYKKKVVTVEDLFQYFATVILLAYMHKRNGEYNKWDGMTDDERIDHKLNTLQAELKTKCYAKSNICLIGRRTDLYSFGEPCTQELFRTNQFEFIMSSRYNGNPSPILLSETLGFCKLTLGEAWEWCGGNGIDQEMLWKSLPTIKVEDAQTLAQR